MVKGGCSANQEEIYAAFLQIRATVVTERSICLAMAGKD
jgi:hypothetical protein